MAYSTVRSKVKILKMASMVDEFLHSPCDQFLGQCTKELSKMAVHYNIEISDKQKILKQL